MIVLLSFVILLLIGVPVAITLAMTAIVYVIVMGEPNLFEMLTQRLLVGADSFSLLAIPLFILAGEIMGFGGITEVLANFVRSLVGYVRGGLAYATVIVGAFLGALLGSANAEAALLGSVLYPELKRDGYEDRFANCLCAATAILGPIIPPSLVFIIYGVIARVSISELFFSGIMPGLLIAVGYMIIIFLEMRNSRIELRRWLGVKHVIKTGITALPALLVPIVILGGILGGVMTPTESAGVAVVVALFLAIFVYKRLHIAEIPKILSRTASVTGVVMFLTVAANSLAWTLALDNVPNRVASMVIGLTNNKWLLLVIMNLILLCVGCVMEPIAAMIIFVPAFLPIAQQLGMDPIHFGLIVSVNLIIGMLTPPVCEVLVTTSSVTGVPFRDCIKPIWKWVVAAVICLLIITYIPAISITIPRFLFSR